MNFFLPLTDKKNRLNAHYIKANRVLIRKNFCLFKECNTDQEKVNLLEKLWAIENNGTLIRDKKLSKTYRGVRFKDQNSLTLFLIKYG
jgi:hypothetical protein